MPYLSIGFFAGLRTAELDGLDWADIDLERKLMTVRPEIAKNRRQRYVEIVRVNRARASDMTYLPMRHGYLDLVAIWDWFSRYVLSWRLSNSLEAEFCREALDEALRHGTPETFNTDQGVQFASETFTGRLSAAGIGISMDGRGRVFDNIFTRRPWRPVKYEDIYPRDYADGVSTREGLTRYFRFYNHQRQHQALGKRTPAEVHGSRN